MDVRRQGWRAVLPTAMATGAIERSVHALPIVRSKGIVDLGRRLSVDQPEIETAVVTETLLIAVDDDLVAERFEHRSIEAEAIRHTERVNFQMIEHEALPFNNIVSVKVPMRRTAAILPGQTRRFRVGMRDKIR